MNKEAHIDGLVIDGIEVPENASFNITIQSLIGEEEYECKLAGSHLVRLLTVNGMDITGEPVTLYGGTEDEKARGLISYKPNTLAVGGIVAVVNNTNRGPRFNNMGRLIGISS